MELWIRSQDKEKLVKIDNIYLSKNYSNKICYADDVFENELGTYKTKERALEVLDEIVSRIEENMNGPIQTVYEMPKE